MSQAAAFDDAVDLLDADHKAVKKLFMDYQKLSDNGAPAAQRRVLAEKICMELTVHAQIEEEIFYPQVGKAIKEPGLIKEALAEHAAVKELIAKIQGMKKQDEQYDAAVMLLGKQVDHHVMEEREQIFLKARYAPLDLRGMTEELFQRKAELKQSMVEPAKEPA